MRFERKEKGSGVAGGRAYDSEADLERMNKFLGSVRVITIQKEVVNTTGFSYWSFAIEYYRETGIPDSPRKNKIDYREILPEAEFAVFSTLRELRKQVAEKEGVPVYTVFTNEQLSEMVKNRVTRLSDMKKIPGVGDKKITAYSPKFLEKLKSIYEKSG